MSLRVLIPLVVLLLGGCASAPLDLTQAPATSRYCDRYFIYRMCVQDIGGDGEVDLMYFEDTMEVFMYRPESTDGVKARLVMHPCAQIMDQGLGDVSTQLLYITDDTGFFQKAELKSELISHYMRYSSKINACNEQDDNNVAQTETEDKFGEFAFENLE